VRKRRRKSDVSEKGRRIKSEKRENSKRVREGVMI